jgi:hypothetical protein
VTTLLVVLLAGSVASVGSAASSAPATAAESEAANAARASRPAPEAAPTPSGRVEAPLYTNEDLDRAHPYRNQTGVASVPASSPDRRRPSSRPAGSPRARGEDYWRKEAARVRERVAGLQARAEEVRADLADLEKRKRETPLGRSLGNASSGGRLKARLAGIERRIRLIEDELRDRARREGALPGWLR